MQQGDIEINVEAATRALDEFIFSPHAEESTRPDVSAIVPRRASMAVDSARARAANVVPVTRISRPPTGRKPLDAVRAFLESGSSLRVIECKAIEASGTGASTIFLRPSQRADPSSPVPLRLPYKAWMTKTSMCAEPYVIFRVPQDRIRQQQRILGYLTSQKHPQPHLQHPLITVTVLLDDTASFRPSLPVHNDLRLTLSTSADIEKGFEVVASAEIAADSHLAHLVAPSTIFMSHAKLSVLPRTAGTALVKITGICVWLGTPSDNQDAGEHEGSTIPVAMERPRLHDELRAANVSISTVGSVSEAEASDSVRSTAKPTQETMRGNTASQGGNALPPRFEAPPVRISAATDAGINVSHVHEQEKEMDSGEGHLSSPSRAAIAAAMKKQALFMLHKFPDLLSREGCKGRSTYNWQKDETLSGTARSDVTSTTDQSLLSSSAGDPMVSQEKMRRAEETAYRNLIDTWEAASTWSVHQGLRYCMQQATSFAFVIAHEGDPRGLMSALTSSFPLTILHLTESEKRADGSRNAGMPQSPLDQLSRLMTLCQGLGYSMQLAFRVQNGFCVTAKAERSLFGETAVMPKIIYTIVASSQEAGVTLRRSSDIYAEANSEATASLRVVLDLADCMLETLPALDTWSSTQAIRYYGSESQSALARFISHACAHGSVKKSHEQLARARTLLLRGFFLSALPIPIEAGNGHAKAFLSLSVRRANPCFLVWQPERQSPRVVLTNAHILDHLSSLNGAIVFDEMVELAGILLADVLDKDAADRKMVPLSEEPWRELERKIRSGSGCLGSDETWLEARRRATVKFAFHALSTAFRRDWQTVGICLPFRCCEGSDVPIALSPGFVDEDALMDTILRWNYPRPSAVVFFYGHSVGAEDLAGINSLPPFRSESLTHFARTGDLTSALE